jgi:hypothetical protein
MDIIIRGIIRKIVLLATTCIIVLRITELETNIILLNDGTQTYISVAT